MNLRVLDSGSGTLGDNLGRDVLRRKVHQRQYHAGQDGEFDREKYSAEKDNTQYDGLILVGAENLVDLREIYQSPGNQEEQSRHGGFGQIGGQWGNQQDNQHQ